ncbi:uncharacterized protein NECHADRAFT_84642 [Fusarium vanettenii 77-13-4]|uniref:Helicase C-terminal domain-containing protein n=1 Tax=Fusarium vanettenii (strain ATCC MYA-4622 / CBS 123669 / FGSC 9596 / NRRL 45880 / 77-13-4) TaxID=660122 RepID=C7YTN3_FUSV7|nr:uncharacterized protein NECHADRAFT_84642 [Fusarium vanettenii 77-13-4]EEU44650.1 hypothetical protein NECHADRAFT_84642 [Fusarium vanettenii 77-13-4]
MPGRKPARPAKRMARPMGTTRLRKTWIPETETRGSDLLWNDCDGKASGHWPPGHDVIQNHTQEGIAKTPRQSWPSERGTMIAANGWSSVSSAPDDEQRAITSSLQSMFRRVFRAFWHFLPAFYDKATEKTKTNARRSASASFHAGCYIDIALYSGLAPERESHAVAGSKSGSRKCIVATNIGEISVTIVYVVETGLVKQAGFNPRVSLNTLRK